MALDFRKENNMTNTVNTPDAHIRMIKSGLSNLLILSNGGSSDLEKALNFATLALIDEVKLLESSLAK